MPGLKPELRAPVVDKIVFGIKAAMDQLRLAVRFGRGGPDPAFRHRTERRQEGAPDRLGESEIGFPVAGVQVVVEDAANAPRAALCGTKKYSSAQALKRS